MGLSRVERETISAADCRPAGRRPAEPRLTVAEQVLALQRAAGNAAVARRLATAPRSAVARQLDVGNLPEKEAGQLSAAWELLKQLDAEGGTKEEIARVAEIAKQDDIAFLGQSMLARIGATPNTKLVILGGLPHWRKADEAGGTKLIARHGGKKEEDVGYLASEKFGNFLRAVPADQRQSVQ